MVNKYCTDDDLLVYLPSEMPTSLNDADKREETLVLRSSAWVDSVFRTTAPFPDIGDGTFETARSNADGYGPREQQCLVLDTKDDAIIVDGARINVLYSNADNDLLPEDSNGRYIALFGTPLIVRQATIEYAMSIAVTIRSRSTMADDAKAWRKQAEMTLGVMHNFATVRPHPYIPHNTGVADVGVP